MRLNYEIPDMEESSGAIGRWTCSHDEKLNGRLLQKGDRSKIWASSLSPKSQELNWQEPDSRLSKPKPTDQTHDHLQYQQMLDLAIEVRERAVAARRIRAGGIRQERSRKSFLQVTPA